MKLLFQEWALESEMVSPLLQLGIAALGGNWEGAIDETKSPVTVPAFGAASLLSYLNLCLGTWSGPYLL